MRALSLLLLLGLAACGERPYGRDRMEDDGRGLLDTGDPGEQPVFDEVRSLPFKHVEWDYKFSNRQIARLTLTGDQLFLETYEHEIVAMDRYKGETQWIFRIDTQTPLDWAPVVAHGVPEEIQQLQQDLALINRQIDDKMKETGPGKETQALQKKRQEIRERLKVAAFGDNCYFISRQTLYCLDRLNGGLRWTHRLGFIPSAQPFAIRNFVFVPGAERARVWVLEVDQKGAERTFYKADITTPENHVMNRAIYSPPSLFFVSHDGKIYSYNVDTSNLTWTYPTERKLQADPVIYTYRHEEEIKGPDAKPGAPALPGDPNAPAPAPGMGAPKAMGAPAMGAPAMGAPAMGAMGAAKDDGKGKKSGKAAASTRFLFVGGMDNAFYALDADAGALVWKYECAAEIKTPAVAKDSTVYVKTDEGALHAFEILPMHRDPRSGAALGPKRNGNLRWKIPLAERFLIKGKENVYIMGPKNTIWAVNEMDGATRGRYPLNLLQHVTTNTADDLIYFANASGYVFCLRESKRDY